MELGAGYSVMGTPLSSRGLPGQVGSSGGDIREQLKQERIRKEGNRSREYDHGLKISNIAVMIKTNY